MKDILTTLPRALQAELVEKKRVDVLINLTRKLALGLEPTVGNLDKIADDVVASLSGWIYFNRWINDAAVYDPRREDVQWINSFSQFLLGLEQNTYTINSKAYKTVDSRLREINKAICDIVDVAGEDWHIRYRCNNWDHEESWWWVKPWNDNDDHSRRLDLIKMFESLEDLEDLAEECADEGSYLSQEWRKLEGKLRDKAGIQVPVPAEPHSESKNADGDPRRRRSHRSKRGIGGMGPKTEFMKKQLKSFGRFLKEVRYGGDESKLYALAKQCWFANNNKWDKAKSAKGQDKGYSSSKVMADAYKKTKQ